MPTLYDDYLNEARARARDRSFATAKEKVKAKRESEKLLKKNGLGSPFDAMTLRDIEKLSPAVVEELANRPEFAARVKQLEDEVWAAKDAALEAEDTAAAAAALTAPPAIALSRRHLHERRALLLSAGVRGEEEADRAPPAAREAYRQLLARQRQETENA